MQFVLVRAAERDFPTFENCTSFLLLFVPHVKSNAITAFASLTYLSATSSYKKDFDFVAVRTADHVSPVVF